MLVFYITLSAWLERLGGIGLVLLGFADNSVAPLPGSMDALTVILSAHHKEWWPYYAVMATIGGVLGGYVTYTLGRKGGTEALEKRLSRKKAARIHSIFNRYGFWSLFVPALLPPPFPFSPFLITAGVLQYSRRKFFLAVGMARAIRYGALAFLGSTYSKQIFGFFHKYYAPILWTVIALSVLGGLAVVFYLWKRKRKGKPMMPRPKKPSVKAA